MAKIGIYYGSTTGATEDVAKSIAEALGVVEADVYDVAKAGTDFSNYEVILFGSSTMGYGDLQDDWDDYIEKIKVADLSGKKIALFGCGDSASYSDTFGDAVGIIYKAIKGKGCAIIGQISTEGYTYDASAAVVDGKLVGLLIDNDNEPDMTEERIFNWVNQLKGEI